MTSDDLQLLREFRAGIPAPDELTRRTAYAYATSAGGSRSLAAAGFRVRQWRSWRGGLLVAAAVLALAGTAVAIADHSLFGISNHGRRVHAGHYMRDVLKGDVSHAAGLPSNAQRPDSFKRLALRQGIGVYTARTIKGNHRCYYQIQGNPGNPSDRFSVLGYGCDPYAGHLPFPERFYKVSQASGSKVEKVLEAWMRHHPFPSPTRPVLDMSSGGEKGAFIWLQPVGLAANGVRSIQLLAQSDCHPVVTVPVINNVYIDANPPRVGEALMVARNASGKIIWHSALFRDPYSSPHYRTPTDRKMPLNCGFR